jgi:hypothetical protein
MLIYIDFNGMTRMRVVGLLGITSVVVGFALVMVKIQRQQSFAWLLRRQLWVVWLAEYLYLVMPVDTLIHTYNVRQILSGNSAPIVQVTAHPVDDEALPVLLPLCQSNDALISQGVSGLLMTRFSTLEDQLSEADRLGWTAWQNGQVRCQAQLKESRPRWDTHANLREARVAFEQLQGHAKANWW